MGALMAHTKWLLCYYPVHWWQQKVLGYFSYRVKYQAYTRSSLRNQSVSMAISCSNAGAPVAQLVTAPEFRRPRFKSWLDLNVFFHQHLSYPRDQQLAWNLVYPPLKSEILKSENLTKSVYSYIYSITTTRAQELVALVALAVRKPCRHIPLVNTSHA